MVLSIMELLIVLFAFISLILALKSISLEKQFTNVSHFIGEIKFRMNVLIILQGLVCFLFTTAFILFLIVEKFSLGVQIVAFLGFIVEIVAVSTYMITKLKVIQMAGS